jgi:peptide/nickel transport system substrate-binding protein
VRAALAAATLALLPAAAAAGVRPVHGGTVRVALPAPAGGSGPGALLVARATAAPLLEVDALGALVPGALAEVPLPEAGGRAFRLRLRPGLVDAAGRPFGAERLAAHLGALLSRGAAAWVVVPVLGADALLDGRAALLAGVQVLSPAELLVTLAFPLPEFPWLLAALPAALPEAGPFVAEPRRSPSSPLVLRANGRHHLGRPFADALEVRAADARAAARQLEQGGLDLVLRPEAAGGRAGPPLPALTATVAVVNAGRIGPGAEAVRRALEALDRGELARRFVRGTGEPLRTLVPPAILPGDPPAPDPGAGPAQPGPARIALLADASAPEQRALAERIQVKLFDRGLRVALEHADRARHAERLAAGDYDVALLTVDVAALRPALAAGQVAHAARGPAAARRAMAELAGLPDDAALAAAARLARELGIVPLVASGARASLGAALQGFAPGPDGAADPGALWLLGGPR